MTYDLSQIDDNELYTTDQIADFVGLDVSYIRRLLIRGEDLRGRKLGRQWVVEGRDLKKWLQVREG